MLPRCASSTLAKLRYGADRRSSRKLHAIIDAFSAGLTVVSFDEAVAAQFGSVAATLVRQGTSIGDFGALIAAHALALDLILVTNNMKHFSQVDGLRIDNWVYKEAAQ